MTIRMADVEKGFLSAGIPPELVSELLEAFAEAKRRYFRADLRPNAVEGGRFAEAAFRILQWETTGRYVPLGKSLPSVDQILRDLQNAKSSDSIRLHLPRTLRVIYDIRNKRDAAHLGDGIDPNMQDATLVVRNMEWVMAELVRLHHDLPADEAHSTIVELVSKDVPVIQVFDGFPRLLKLLKASDHCLVLLYWRGPEGATYDELSAWVRPTMRGHLRRTLTGLDKKDFVHNAGDRWFITWSGEGAMVSAGLVEPA